MTETYNCRKCEGFFTVGNMSPVCSRCHSLEQEGRLQFQRDAMKAGDRIDELEKELADYKSAADVEAREADRLRKELAKVRAETWREAAKIAMDEPCKEHGHGHLCAEYLAEDFEERAKGVKKS